MTGIGFIGGGKMAEAVIKGLISARIVPVSGIRVSEPDPARRNYLEEQYLISVFGSNREVVAQSDVIILAVKPQVIPRVLPEVMSKEEKLLISVAAGITLAYLEKHLPGFPIIRTMPNNPALVGAGVTALVAGSKVSKKQLEKAKEIFCSVGEVIEIREELMDAVTGLSGSGPAYIYLMIEAMVRAGVELGIEEKTAEKLAAQTVLGAGRTMLESGRSARELREMVTSPGGTTIEGLKILEKGKVADTLAEAVRAAAEKSKKLSQ